MLTHSNKKTQTGFTLTELMIALVLGLLMIAAASIIFLQGKRNFLQNEQVSRIQENGRYALKVLSRDISMAGFMGELYAVPGQAYKPVVLQDDTSIALGAGDDCGPGNWFADIDNSPIQLVDGVTGDVPATFTCIAATDYLGFTDAIAIKRTADSRAFATVADTADCGVDETCCNTSYAAAPASCALDANTTYLATDGDEGLLFHHTVASPGMLPDLRREDWQYLVRVYYIQPYSVDATTDSIPTLCREVLQNKAFVKECLAEGIEDMQIELGLDTNQDGVVEEFEPAPTTAELDQAIIARIFLLVRGTDDMASIDNTKTYNLGSRTVGPFNDGFYRRVFSTNVQIRNVQRRNRVPPGA